MNRVAVLLRPGENLKGEIEAVLTGWERDKFTEDERSELEQMRSPFLEGEVPASTPVNLK